MSTAEESWDKANTRSDCLQNYYTILEHVRLTKRLFDSLVMELWKRHWQSAHWLRSVSASTLNLQLVLPDSHAPSLNKEFPWAEIKYYTDLYLSRKKRGRLTQNEIDVKLAILFQRYPRKDVAIAACGHALSAAALRDLIEKGFNFEPSFDIENLLTYRNPIEADEYVHNGTLRSYLQAFLAANYVNNESLDASDVNRAKTIIAALDAISSGEQLRMLIEILVAGVPRSSLLYRHIGVLFRKSCCEFSAELMKLGNNGEWFRAYEAASWLSKVTEASFDVSPTNAIWKQVLNYYFPSWLAWVAWRPNVARIKLWQELSSQNRGVLVALLAQEGPDFLSRQTKLSVGASAVSFIYFKSQFQVGLHQFLLEHQLPDEGNGMLDRLLDLISAAITAGPADVTLLATFVSDPITYESLDILEIVHKMSNPLISSALCTIHKPTEDSVLQKWAGVEALLPVLVNEEGRALRDLVMPRIVKLGVKRYEDLMAELQTELANHRPWICQALDLYAFLEGLKKPFWLRLYFPAQIRDTLDTFSTSSEEIRTLGDIWTLARSATPQISGFLIPRIQLYCKAQFIQKIEISDADKHLMRKLASLWMETSNNDVRIASLRIANINWNCSRLCSQQTQFLEELLSPPKEFIKFQQLIEVGHGEQNDMNCISFCYLLQSVSLSNTAYIRHCLYHIVELRQQHLVDYGVNNMKAKDWVQFVKDLHSYCNELTSSEFCGKISSTPVALEPALLVRAEQLSDHLPVLELLEETPIDSAIALKALLSGGIGNESVTPFISKILIKMTTYCKGTRQQSMLATLRRLNKHCNNAEAVHAALCGILLFTAEDLQALNNSLDLYQNHSTKQVAKVMLASKFNAQDMEEPKNKLLRQVARFLGLDTRVITSGDFAAAAEYMEAQYASILGKAKWLGKTRAALYMRDPKGISETLDKLGIDCPPMSPLDEEIANLPTALIGMIERVGARDVEFQFPLTDFKTLQKIAMGLGNSQSLVLRVNFDESMKPKGFCLHFDGDLGIGNDSPNHQPGDISSENLPENPFCFDKTNRTNYQLTRILMRYFQSGSKSLEDIYTVTSTTLRDLSRSCLICGRPHAAKLRRSTVCSLEECSRLFLRADLEIRVAEILHDPQVADLLLTSIFHAASTSNMALLPGAPFQDTLAVSQALSKVPQIAKLAQAPNLATAMRDLGPDTEKLLSWACLSYRGFLASATGILKIPGMPVGTHQFVLASAAPHLEAAFAKQVGGKPTRVLWHGTYLNRLFAILNQGLEIKSGTPLQAHGASNGSGIYTAEEPATSLAYCGKTAEVGWKGSTLNGCTVLLGVEVASSQTSKGNICVVKKKDAVMVRHIFLIPVGARMPTKANLLPAMVSAYHSLRVGSV